jgi:serine/threonine-protein kinase
VLPPEVASSDADTQLRYACGELCRLLSAGEACRSEDFLTALPTLAADAARAVELICTEFRVRFQLGQNPNPEEWYDRFPQWRQPLRGQLQVEGLVPVDLSGEATVPEIYDSRPEQAPALTPGEGGRFAHYELFEELGRGGMGVVTRARDTILGRIIALKRINAGALAQPQEVERFLREAKAAAQLRHRHIVTVHHFGCHEGQHYLTMPFVPGGSLARQLDRFYPDPRQAVTLMVKVARAVQAAHEQGIIHRDLKPGNVLLDENDEPLVSDFGLAKFLEASAELTYSGQVLGTPAYMAPEQAAGHAGHVSARSDVWSLGVMLFQLLTGQRPFSAKGAREATEEILTTEPPRPRRLRPELDRRLERVVLRCLEKDPARRYRSAEALADDLDRWLRGEAVVAPAPSWFSPALRELRRRPWRYAALLLGAAALVTAALLLQLADPGAADEKKIEQELARGQTVTLIGERNGPAVLHWTLNSGGAISSADGAFTVTAQQLSLLRLVAKPPPHFRFRAQVRENDLAHLGAGGVYFSDNGTSQERWFISFTFDDWHTSKNAAGQLVSTAVLTLNRFPDLKARRPHQLVPQLEYLPLEADQRGAIPWRSLEVEVKPDAVEAWWEEHPLGRADAGRLAEVSALLSQPPRGRLNGSPFQTAGELGLFVLQGDVSFRRVVVEPLD